tara:strand:+ start:2044 stop:2751 length:708 start_codon:yes stop_codon:yes gene_type:complete
MGIKKKLKRIINNFNINKNFGKYETNRTIKTDWHKYNINRIAFINSAIRKILNEKKDCKYLEIGCDDNFVFNSLILPDENKIGVDPKRGGNHRMTSDEFFSQNKKNFDVIFIDGLHHYKQCQKDVINSLKFLNMDGYIFIHDLLPLDWKMELVPRIQGHWNGDVWKVGYELSKIKNLEFRIANIDSGIGYLKKRSEIKYIKLPELLNKRFKDYLNIYNELPLINPIEALKEINNE